MRVCKSCGEDFTYTQKGRGRPPVYCASCKEARSTKPLKAAGRPIKGEARVIDGMISVGDTVVSPLKNFFGSREKAIMYATILTVEDIQDSVVTVSHPKEKSPLKTNLSNLVKVEVSHA